MSTDPSVADQLQVLRQVTKTTGIMHDFQVLQMRCWGGMMFDKNWELAIDIEKNLIRYTAAAQVEVPELLYIEVAKMAKWMLGDEWNVEVIKGKKSIGLLPTELSKKNAKKPNGRRDRGSNRTTNHKGKRSISKVR